MSARFECKTCGFESQSPYDFRDHECSPSVYTAEDIARAKAYAKHMKETLFADEPPASEPSRCTICGGPAIEQYCISSKCGPAQPAEPAFDGCARCGSRYHLSAQCETPIERCGPDNYRNGKYVGEPAEPRKLHANGRRFGKTTAHIAELAAKIERLREENADLERSREMLARKESEYLDRCKERDEARAAFEQEREYSRLVVAERDAALAEIERLRDMLDDLQLPKVGRKEPRKIK